MRTLSLVLVTFILVACGALSSPSIDDHATAHFLNGTCRVSIAGQFPNMAHDPITLLFSGHTRITARFYVPSLSGAHAADKIRVTYEANGVPWDVGDLSGTVTFEAQKVIIDLIQRDPDRAPKAIDFNGTFTLENPNACD